MRRRNALPNLYWNRATRAHFRSPLDATPTDTVLRMLEAADADFFVPPRRIADRERVLRGTRPVDVQSRNGRYAVQLRSRSQSQSREKGGRVLFLRDPDLCPF